MKELHHPNIMRCLGYFEAKQKIWIEQELYQGELQKSYIEKFFGQEVPELEILKILWQVS